MEQENDVAYYRRREAAARALAAGSSDPAIKRIHTDMAERYAAQVRRTDVRPKLTLV